MSSAGGSSVGPDGPRRTRTQRLEALSDGVFGFAITLLAVDLVVPVNRHSERHLLNALGDQWPGYLGYLVSFSTIGAVWLGHNAISDYLDHADTTFLRLNLLLLLLVSFLPFPTRLLAEYIRSTGAERVSVTAYGLTLLVAAAVLSLVWRYALHARLIRPDAKDEEITLLSQRLTPGLAAYVVLIVAGLFLPVLAVLGYGAIAVYLLLPIRIQRRRPKSE